MSEKAKIRFLTVPLLEAIKYIKPLMRKGVQIVPMGPVGLNVPPWDEFAELFTTGLVDDFVNIVCAPAGVQLSPPIIYDPTRPEESEWTPGTIFATNWAEGVPNIAIVLGHSLDDPGLERYDAVYWGDAIISKKILEGIK